MSESFPPRAPASPRVPASRWFPSARRRPPWIFLAVAVGIALIAVALLVLAAARIGTVVSGSGSGAGSGAGSGSESESGAGSGSGSGPVDDARRVIPSETATATPPARPHPTAMPAPQPRAEPNPAPSVIPPEEPPVTIGQTGPTILSFSAQSPVAMCKNEFTAKVELDFTWRTQGATDGWFAPGTINALLDEPITVDLTTQGISGVVFDCRDNQEIYALTVSDGMETVSATTFVVRRLIWPE